MEVEKAFFEVEKAISAGDVDAAETMLLSLASSSGDPFVRIQCASTLMIIGRTVSSENILEELSENLPEGTEALFQVAQAMRGLGRADLAAGILADLGEEDAVMREYALVLNMLGRYEDSVSVAEKISYPFISDRVLMADGLSSSGEFRKALELTESMLNDFPESYDVQRSRCTALISAGMDKEAVKFVRTLLKNDKNSSDANAVAAYVMHVEGKSQSAGAFASKALRLNPSHIGAMETLALSLMDRGKFREASIVAGAMNEKEPGNPAAVGILKECNGKQ
ncbi:MAG: tetratricopeptide repeat protein [Candidatus Methanomethylophilaceae archaeon]|nr:hypothetical protein [Candidatus Methanomethylophilaceae archaeon]